MSLTEDQRRAVGAKGSVAVVAGAGTGKTHMLTERYLHHLSEDGCSPLEVVAVTFTEKAAAELKSRIRRRVAQRMPEGEDLLAELEAAQISTIHALCARICREHPDEAGVPADFGILDGLRGRLWTADRLTDALDELPAEHYRALPYPMMRIALEALFADPIAAEQALERGTEGWEALATEARTGALRRLLGDPELKKVRGILNTYRGSPNDRMEEQRQAAASALEGLDAVLRASDADTKPLLEAISGVRLNVGSVRNWGEGELGAVKDALKIVREIVRTELDRGMVALEVGPADERLAEALPVLKDAFGIARDFVSAAKRRARLLGFSDLEVHALRALEHEGVRAYYRERWRAFLVDEFQDTNPVQAELLDGLTEGAKLTVVGDEKQSIYGFRRADVAVFRRFRERILSEGGSEALLATSFRAHAELMQTFNAVFSPVLGVLHQDLGAHRTQPPHAAPHVRAFAMEAEGKVPKAMLQRAEAAHLARLVRKMLDEGVPIYDDNTGTKRSVRPGDIAFLSRVWAPLELYGEALAAAGIPSVHAGGGNLLETREAKDGLALLRFLADARDDLALVALLRSPFLAVDDRLLHELAQEREKGTSWWRVVRDAPEPRLVPAKEVLGELLSRRRLDPPTALLKLADRLTGYTAVIANLPGAERREADWRGFGDLVRDLEHGADDAFTVVRWLRGLQEAGAEVPRPPLEAGDAVSLMTVHSAKGLEWPVVVMPDLARGYPSDSSPTLFDPELGVAVTFGEDDGEPVLYRLIADRKALAREAEARRLFYVACTRARDHLVLTSTEGTANRLCGLALLQPGLEAADVFCSPVSFRPKDAHPPELPTPSPAKPPSLLIGPID